MDGAQFCPEKCLKNDFLKNIQKRSKNLLFGLKNGGGGQKDFWTIFCDFFSEIDSDPQTFLEVKQDPQAGP